MKNKLAIYEKALELYIAEKDSFGVGLCHLLTEAILLLEHGLTYKEAFEHYYEIACPIWDYVKDCLEDPNNIEMLEISKYRPETYKMYWFSTNDKVMRTTILELAIKSIKDE